MGLYLGISFISIVEIVGELGLFRLLPRLFGLRGLYGLAGYGAPGSAVVGSADMNGRGILMSASEPSFKSILSV